VRAHSTVTLAALVVESLGCVGLLRAGLLEARGLLEGARTASRSAGFVTIAAGATAAVAALVPPGPPFPSRLAVPALALAAGWIALLAGLAGKPRPSGNAAAALVAGALIALCLVR
jgi:hypothetical protein